MIIFHCVVYSMDIYLLLNILCVARSRATRKDFSRKHCGQGNLSRQIRRCVSLRFCIMIKRSFQRVFCLKKYMVASEFRYSHSCISFKRSFSLSKQASYYRLMVVFVCTCVCAVLIMIINLYWHTSAVRAVQKLRNEEKNQGRKSQWSSLAQSQYGFFFGVVTIVVFGVVTV